MSFNPIFKTEPVNFCGVDCFVREWSSEDREVFEQLVLKDRPTNKIRPCYVVNSLVDADGNKLFTTDQLEEIGKLPFSEVLKVVTLVEKINGLKVSIGELGKN
jgi:hypothetical protein